MDRLAAMETFVRVVETGSFSAAARGLNVGQPAVSKTVAQMEERLGVRLLMRSTHGLSPTEAGQSFYDRARRVIEEADEAELAARGAGASLTGRLRVCAAVTFARLHVVPHLPKFLASHPGLTMDVVLDDRPIDLVEEGVDVALRMGLLGDSTFTARKLASGSRHVVGTPAYFERCGVPASPAALAEHAEVIYAQGGGGEVWSFRQGAAEVSVTVSGPLRVSAAEGVRAGVLADGIGDQFGLDVQPRIGLGCGAAGADGLVVAGCGPMGGLSYGAHADCQGTGLCDVCGGGVGAGGCRVRVVIARALIPWCWTSRVDWSLIHSSDKARRYGVMSSEDPKPGRVKRPAASATQPQRQGRSAANARADYSRTTRDVSVSVRSFFLADQSQPEESHFVWAYRVKIENQGPEPIQLLRRTWQITDARGRTQHVHGTGVVGEQPLLEPGESFEYTSGTPLDTPSGFMVGAYHMVVPSSGESFDVAIPAFSLDSPHQSGRVH